MVLKTCRTGRRIHITEHFYYCHKASVASGRQHEKFKVIPHNGIRRTRCQSGSDSPVRTAYLVLWSVLVSLDIAGSCIRPLTVSDTCSGTLFCGGILFRCWEGQRLRGVCPVLVCAHIRFIAEVPPRMTWCAALILAVLRGGWSGNDGRVHNRPLLQ